MDWRRFKTIIIIVLIFINIFFMAYFVQIKMSDRGVSNATKANVISVLEKNNIHLDEDLFPKNKKTYSACYVSRILESDTEAINKIKGKSGTVTVQNEVFHFSINSGKEVELNEDAVLNACRSFMEESGIYDGLYEAEDVKLSSDKAQVRFCLSFDNCKFFDSYIDFTVTKKGISSLEGKNIIKAEKSISSYEDELMPAQSIIVAVSNDKEAESPVKITDITFGYYLGDSAGVYVSVLALPVWRITFDDRTTLYYDARNGNDIEMK